MEGLLIIFACAGRADSDQVLGRDGGEARAAGATHSGEAGGLLSLHQRSFAVPAGDGFRKKNISKHY